MILIEDSRQQEGKHQNIEDYCKRNGITLIRKCLNVGDYMISEDGVNPSGSISVDTKTDCMELLKDVMSNDHRRFKAECVRAQEAGIKLIVLVEEELPYGRLDLWEVPKWQNSNKWHMKGEPMSRIEPKVFRKALLTMTRKYGVEFRFCSKKQCPSRVIKYLKGEFK